jgi:tRNA A37 threonylcarbamoyladenosine dehydratase
MSEKFIRTENLIGKENLDKLKNSHIAIFGIGGVGGYVTEALVRAGVGKIDIIDNDTISESNINRQIIATTKSVGKFKVDVMKERILEINPNVQVNAFNILYLPNTANQFDFTKYDYIIDAVDNVTAKIELVIRANNSNVPIISSMGTGNKLDPTAFEISDIYKTEVCPLAKVMRLELKKRGVKKLKVIYSKEKPITNQRPPASISFVPSVAGLIIASEVVKDIIKESL